MKCKYFSWSHEQMLQQGQALGCVIGFNGVRQQCQQCDVGHRFSQEGSNVLSNSKLL